MASKETRPGDGTPEPRDVLVRKLEHRQSNPSRYKLQALSDAPVIADALADISEAHVCLVTAAVRLNRLGIDPDEAFGALVQKVIAAKTELRGAV